MMFESSRNVTNVFVGACCFPRRLRAASRALRMAAIASRNSGGSASLAGRAFLKSASVHSGLSSSIGFRFGIKFPFLPAGSSKADHSHCLFTPRENDCVQLIVKHPDRANSLFTATDLFEDQCIAKAKIKRTLKWQSSLRFVLLAFRGVIFNLHCLIVTTSTQESKA